MDKIDLVPKISLKDLSLDDFQEDIVFKDILFKARMELMEKIYGPKYCKNCKKIQPMLVAVKAGTERMTGTAGNLTYEFIGHRQCNVCGKGVD